MAQAEPTLRHLTVLFVDTVGSTAIGTMLDPEDLYDLIDGALRAFTTIVNDLGGQVLKYTGDGLLAVFGAGVLHEEGPERAVHAGLAILRAAQDIASSQAEDPRLDGFGVRVGIATGPVILGGGIEGDGSVAGSAVNLAARMEQTAPAGGLQISADTYMFVAGVFDTTERKGVEAKGFGPLTTYIVHGAKAAGDRAEARGIRGVSTTMIARQRELGLLQGAFNEFVEQPRCAARVVVSEPGIGKSRLLREFLAWVEQQPSGVLAASIRAQLQTRQQPYGLLRALFNALLGITDHGSGALRQQDFSTRTAELLGGAGSHPAHLLGQLLGFDFATSPAVQGIVGDPQQLRMRAYREAHRLLDQMGPVLVVVDDLHWADDASLDFLSGLRSVSTAQLGVLVVAATRPALLDRRASLLEELGFEDVRIDLGPLEAEHSQELIDALLHRLESVPPALQKAMQHSDGNPFFMEEIVRMLLDEGVMVTREQGPWQVAEDKLEALRIPRTLTGVLQARLDSLALQERSALQQASVVGFRFWDRAVEALDERAPMSLGALAERGLVQENSDSALVGATELTFKHHLLHQFTYDSVLKRDRRVYHARAAAWLEMIAAETGNEMLGQAGEHYERAGAVDQAVDYYARASEHAAAVDANDLAVEFATRGLELARADDWPIRWRLLMAREDIRRLQADRVLHGQDLDQLEFIAETLNDDDKRAEVALRRSKALILLAEPALALAAAESAVRLAEKVGAIRTKALAHSAAAVAARRMGDLPQAKDAIEQALTLTTGMADLPLTARLYTTWSNVLGESGDMFAATQVAEHGLQIYRDLGDAIGVSDILDVAGWAWSTLGDYMTAGLYLSESLQIARDLGWAYGESVALMNLAGVLHLVGEHDQAVVVATDGIDVARRNGGRDVEATCCIPLAHSLIALQRWDEARQWLSRARELFVELDAQHSLQEVAAGFARLELQQGHLAAAMAEIEPILQFLDGGGDLDGTDEPLRIRLICFEGLRACGDVRATNVLTETYALLQQRAQAIPDEAVRNRFLNGVSHHATILREQLAG
jgi:class 3 adenylate cyclase/tetratricopeptide (TPR) repeat protein